MRIGLECRYVKLLIYKDIDPGFQEHFIDRPGEPANAPSALVRLKRSCRGQWASHRPPSDRSRGGGHLPS